MEDYYIVGNSIIMPTQINGQITTLKTLKPVWGSVSRFFFIPFHFPKSASIILTQALSPVNQRLWG